MSARSEPTILLVLRDFIARADVVRGASPHAIALLRAPRPATDDLTQLVEAALHLGKRPKGPVWVLTDEIFSQSVSMSARALRNLGDDEIAQALAYEAQLLSGLEAAESTLAWKPTSSDGAESEYWITAMSRAERDRVDAMIRRAGARLAGVLHPVGLPRPLAAGLEAGRAWKRVETWHELWAEIESTGRGNPTVRVRRADPTRRHREMRSEGAPTETLVTVATASAAPTDATALRFEDEAALITWLAGWSAVLAEAAPAIPIIEAAARPVSVRTQVVGAIAGLAIAVGACAFHDSTLRSEEIALSTELARVRAPSERLSSAEQEVLTIKKEIDELRASAADRAARTRTGGWSPELPARMMQLLAAEVPNGLAVDEFELGWRSSAIRGLCVEPHLADRLGGALARAIATDGYSVTPSTKRRRTDGPGTGLYEFEIEVMPSAHNSQPTVPQD
jgi:hypothetical protein